VPPAADFGLTRRKVLGARQVRDAERLEPGCIWEMIRDAEERGEGTRADIQRSVVAWAETWRGRL
jgi:hypothetical protein